MIRAGRVTVDGIVVTQLGTKVDPRAAEIRVDGRPLRPQALRYILLNKPSGFITTTDDERGRDTVMDLVPVRERLFPVGRLDRDTEGLLLLTNDGDVANRVMHPRYRLAKEYTVLTPNRPPEAVFARVRKGVVIEGKRIVPEEFRILRETRDGILLTITVHEGLNRLVRRIMDEAGIELTRLRRVRIGPLDLGSIPLGTFRDLTPGELASLLQALRLDRGAEGQLTRPVVRGGPVRHAPATRPRRGDGDNRTNRSAPLAEQSQPGSGARKPPTAPSPSRVGDRDRDRRQSPASPPARDARTRRRTSPTPAPRDRR